MLKNIPVIAVLIALSVSCGGDASQSKNASLKKGELREVKIAGNAQGTTYNITYYTDLGINMKPPADSLLLKIDHSLSLWDKGSLLTAMNTRDTGEVVIHDTHNFITENFKIARDIYVKTEGAFDPTVGPLVDLWGFGTDERGEITEGEIEKLMPKIGFEFDKVRLTQYDSAGKAGPVRLFYRSDPGIRIDFNGIAQGYSVDRLARLFEENGISDYMIELGGEIKTRGKKPDGKSWKIGIDKPTERGEGRTLQIALTLDDRAAATSGSYRKYFEKGGKKYSHTIDPETGKPVDHNLISVTVVSDECILADAYGTAFMVMGTEKTLEFVKNNPDLNLEVYLIYDDNGTFKTAQSDGMREITEELGE